MMAPPETARLQLDVRLHGGRAMRYPLDGEFLIGSAPGCDLLLPGGQHPPVVCQFSEHGGVVRLRRLGPSPVHINDRILESDAPVDVADGDRIALGPVEITLVTDTRALLHPKLLPLDALTDDAHLRQAALDEQARELEEDRRLWYRRRQEMEADLARMKAELAARGQQEIGDLAERERELASQTAELNAGRLSLNRDYETKRDELARLHEQVSLERAALDGRAEEFEQHLQQRNFAFEADLDRRRAELENVFVARQREIEAEIAKRRLEFEDDLRDCEPRLVELRLARDQMQAERQGVDHERRAVLALRGELSQERQAVDGQRHWQVERLEKLEADLAGREADLARRDELLRSERHSYETARDAHKDDLLRLNRWQGSLETTQAALDGRAAEVDERFHQLRRDAADLEDQLRLATREEERLHAEAERQNRLKAEIETQAAKFAERAAQVEAQQAMLAVLRAKLDRQQVEIRGETDALAIERQQQETLRRELDGKLRDAELLQAELGFLRDDHEQKHRAVQEQQSLFSTTLEEFRRQKDEAAAADFKLKEREDELEARATETAEQAATLKSKLLQSLDLQQRLESDRVALRDREAALNEAEAARQALQEQLRRRSEELASREKQLDLSARGIAEDKAILDRGRSGIDQSRVQAEAEIAARQQDLEARAAEIALQTTALVERETAMGRQVERMKEVGTALAAERKSLFEARQAWEAEQANHRQTVLLTRHEAETFQTRVAEQVAELRRQAPDLEHHAAAALEKLGGARETLRLHLADLHEFAKQSREALVADSERLRQREQIFEKAQAEHRVAVAGFRQQVLDWQGKVADVRQAMSQHDAKFSDRHTDLDATAKRLEQMQSQLQCREMEIERERRIADDKRNEMERHLADMREWYRKKLRDLVAGRTIDDADMPAWEIAEESRPVMLHVPPFEGDPADAQLGEVLRSRGLVDENALQALWNEARRQRKSLRQTLLASGVVTVYQLALIEAGNLDGLVLGRFRVIDRMRATPRELAWRVFDPARANVPTVLRVLNDGDDVHRAEYHQRFAAAAQAHHAHLANVFEVLEIQGRPAVLTEAVSGVPSSDWPPLAATPGVWLKLVSDAASAIAQAHSVGLVHGRLAAESFVLTADGTLKLTGLGEPAWLSGSNAIFDPLPAADLRALGRVAYAWSQIGARRRANKGKPFPAELAAIVRRLEAGAESAMDDIISLERPYADAKELVTELERLREAYPCPHEVWTKLLKSISEGDIEEPLRQSA